MINITVRLIIGFFVYFFRAYFLYLQVEEVKLFKICGGLQKLFDGRQILTGIGVRQIKHVSPTGFRTFELFYNLSSFKIIYSMIIFV